MTDKKYKLKETQTELNISKNEVPTNQQQQIVEKKLTTLTGTTTSQINQALKADNPYPARVFLKVENQETDIPVFFRIKEKSSCQFHANCSEDCRYKKDNWIRPKIKTGSLIQVQGQYSINKERFPNCKMRKSFTAYSYKLLQQEINQQILSHGKS